MKRGHSGSEDDDGANSSRLVKHSKLSELQSGERATHRKDEYDVAWLCALHIEMGAARAMLDETHDPLPSMENDTNSYVLGRIQTHNVVIACLPNAEYGTNNAAHVASNLKRTFPSIKYWLMVGIGGANPSRQDIRLGDVVVGTKVMQYDLGKFAKGELKTTAIPRSPDHSLGTAISNLRSKHELEPNQIPSILQNKLGNHQHFLHPNLPDRLFHNSYEHDGEASSCEDCDPSKIMPRRIRGSDIPQIHYGAIASGNQVMKDASIRDKVGSELDVICFEMEAAGIMCVLPCLPIRGICDYADSHKCKQWQRYAAATASAYARELLEVLPSSNAYTLVSFHSNIDHSKDLQQHRRKKFLGSLNFEQIESQRLTIKEAHEKTCRWFLSHPSYKAWLDASQLKQHHGLLWVCGKPGAGKSTLMKFVHSTLVTKHYGHQVIASFFFNARGESLEKSVSGMYRSLLLQFLEGYPDLQQVLDDPGLMANVWSQDPNPQVLLNHPELMTFSFSQGYYRLSLDVLQNIFRAAIMKLGSRPFTCFIDALDECDEQQAVEMVYFFEAVTKQSTDIRVPLRICFSSRHYPCINTSWSIRVILEAQPGHTNDLKDYTKSSLRITNPRLVKQLQKDIIDKAAGVFLWVVLVVQILNVEDRRGRPTLRKRLEEIPSGLTELLRDLVVRDKDNIDEFVLSTLWILFANRPLRPNEYFHALWSGLHSKGSADTEIPDTSLYTDETATRYVTSSSKGLAEITISNTPTVQFIHESVRDFLLKHNGLNILWAELGSERESPSHDRLKECCEAYLKHATFQEFISETKGEYIAQGLQRFPFLAYASQNILNHAEHAAKAIPQDTFLNGMKLTQLIRILESLNGDIYQHHLVKGRRNILFILADKDYPKLIRAWIKDKPTSKVYGKQFRDALFAAFDRNNKRSIVALFGLSTRIYNGVDITAGFATRHEMYIGLTPLTWAAKDGRAEYIELLLEKGFDIDVKDDYGDTALSEASRMGHEGIVRLLLEKKADVNSTSEDGSTPLISASMRGQDSLVKLFIENGADLHATNDKGFTALIQALRFGHEETAKLLRENGAVEIAQLTTAPHL
ncbi:unnamed protein product [Clonostachys rhizophaga]|uniref:Nucleoside phosphorylase domain-containing protein n=1 Tax=Clonostachys rhizophaga TaxID=160324 RepID=A0A9N9YRH6_9HYPO|nr:unnamed protein product [Clonostachys rhizophaga]